MNFASARPRTLVELKPNVEPPQALPDRIYGILKYRILTCLLPPGQRLMEKEIAEELKVSRTPLREALNRLAQENLVALTPYRGYAVTPVTAKDIRDLCEVRLILETESAGLAAQRATPEELASLERAVDLPYTPGNRETYAGYLKANSVFHQRLARCSHNDRFEAIVTAVLDELQRPLYLGLDAGPDAEAATAEHIVLVNAIKAGDAAGARRLQTEQILRASERMVAAIVATDGQSLGATDS